MGSYSTTAGWGIYGCELSASSSILLLLDLQTHDAKSIEPGHAAYQHFHKSELENPAATVTTKKTTGGLRMLSQASTNAKCIQT